MSARHPRVAGLAKRGIHVGNLEEHERITRILKLALESRYGQPFVTERFGRGVYRQWIGYLPRANRTAKPISSGVSFGCSKFFLTVDTGEKLFKCGLQIERGYAGGRRENGQWELQPDWDWHRLRKALKPKSILERELERLVLDEEFTVFAGAWGEAPVYFSRAGYPGVVKLRKLPDSAPKNHGAGFPIFYPMRGTDVGGSTGLDLVESVQAVFGEVTPAMNQCMQIGLAERTGRE
jgi:hypothetical protein